MKVFKDNKEVKNASVTYYAGGAPAGVTINGVTYDPRAFEFKDDEPTKKTQDVKKGQAKTKAAPKAESGAMTTGDLKDDDRTSKE